MTIVNENSGQASILALSDKQIAERQVEAAQLLNKVTTLRDEVNFLEQFRSKVTLEIVQDEKGNLRDVRMEAGEYQKLAFMIPSLKAEVSVWESMREKAVIAAEEKTKIVETLSKTILSKQHELTRTVEKLEEQIKGLDEILVGKKSEISVEEHKLEDAKKLVLEEEKNIQDAKDKADGILKGAAQERAFLERKARDLAIYEYRIKKRFEELYPGQEMTFV